MQIPIKIKVTKTSIIKIEKIKIPKLKESNRTKVIEIEIE